MTASTQHPASTPAPSPVALALAEVPGALPLLVDGPTERDLGDAIAIATPYYAVTLPKSLLGPSFSWSYDDRCIDTEARTTENYPRVMPYTATGFLTVDLANGTDDPFTVYVQTGQPSGSEPPAQDAVAGCLASLAGNAHGRSYCSWNVFVATPSGTDRWNELVSPDAYALARPEDGGTRVYTPRYSVLVPDGALSEGWSFTYTQAACDFDLGNVGSRLCLYAGEAQRAQGEPAVVFELCTNFSSYTGEHMCDGFAGVLVGEVPCALHVLGEQAEEWAARASLELACDALASASAPITAEAWRVECPYYAFETPEPWRGLVEASLEGGTLSVYPAGVPGEPIVTVEFVPIFGSTYVSGGTKGNLLAEWPNGMGQIVLAWASPRTEANQAFDPSLALEALKPVMTERWAVVHGLVSHEVNDRRPLAEVHAQIRETCGDAAACSWLAELAGSPVVERWNVYGLRAVRSLVHAIVPISQAQTPYDLGFTVSGAINDTPSLGSLEYEMAFWVSDAQVAEVVAYSASRHAQGHLEQFRIGALEFDTNPPASLEAAAARISAAIAPLLRAYARPGVAYAAAWTYTAPDGSQITGYNEA